jgi:hypothetical protein
MDDEEMFENMRKGIENVTRLNLDLKRENDYLRKVLSGYQARDVAEAWLKMGATEDEMKAVLTMLGNCLNAN